MSLKDCAECGKPVSTEAKACPNCGAKIPKTKWWLWIPLGLIFAFFLFGALIPENVAKSNSAYRACTEMYRSGAVATMYECDRLASEIRNRK